MDWYRIFQKDMLVTLDQALPCQFAKYATTSIVPNAMAAKKPVKLLQKIEEK